MNINIRSLKKSHIIIGAILSLVLIAILTVVVVSSIQKNNRAMEIEEVTEAPEIEELEVIPTVDSSVKVKLEDPEGLMQEVILSIKGIPKGTELIEYDITYDTVDESVQGTFGEIELEEKEDAIERDLTLGTCSSGSCVYHKIDGDIKVRVKFEGTYGQQLFEDDFSL